MRAAGLLLLFIALAVLHTWPLASDLAGLSRLDNDDAGLNIFVISWIATALLRDPLRLFDAPMFFPEPLTLAYSEHMLVPAVMGAPLLWSGVAPEAVYNVLALAGFALSGWTMALVVRSWTGSTTGGVAAGMLYAFNAHQLTRLVHLQALHVEFLPIALFGLDRLLRTPSTASTWRPAAMLVAGFTLQALCSNYTLVFLSAALLVAALVRSREWLETGARPRLRTLVGAGVAAVVVLSPFLWPYYVVSREQGLSRSIDEVALYSASWRDYLATGARLHLGLWSERFLGGTAALFPGIVPTGLAGYALLRRETRADPRVLMTTAFGLAGLALSFGPALPGYSLLHAHVPLFEGLRAAARWGVLLLTAVAILAGFALAALERRWAREAYWPAVSVALLGVLTLEALRAPMTFVATPKVPTIYASLRQEPDAVLVEMPLFSGLSVSENARYLFNATRHLRPLVNGYSGFETEAFRQRAARWRDFPSDEVVDEMVSVGVTHVAVHAGDLDPVRVDAAAARPDLRLVAEEGPVRLYRLLRP